MHSRYPVDGALDLAAIGRHTVRGLEVCGALQLDNFAVFILHDLVALHNISAHQAHLAIRLEALELRGRNLGKVALFNVNRAGKGDLAGAGRLVTRVVRHLKILGLICRIIRNGQLDRFGDRHAAQGGFV